MYKPTHGAAAIAIFLSGLPMTVALPLAILSHIPIDAIGEGYVENYLWYEIPLLLAMCLVAAVKMPYLLFLVILGIFAGNFIDILDKVILKKLFGRDDIIHSAKWYPRILLQLTSKQTIFFDLIAVLIVMALINKI